MGFSRVWTGIHGPELMQTASAEGRLREKFTLCRQGDRTERANQSARQSLSRSENQTIASTINGQRNVAPPGKIGLGTEAMTSNRSA